MSISRQDALAPERIGPIVNTQGSASGFTQVCLVATEARIIRGGACFFMQPLRLDRREQLRSFDETRRQSFWKQGKEGSEIVEKPARASAGSGHCPDERR